ncbi:MAG: VCBS repeat-containing protein, partial [Calditrichaeota bacterium]|nr:VCBS repeat-containing protein [Calditrichota bacterium]
IIADNFESASSVYAVDIDGDSDMDVLGTSWNINDITWWENDGEQDFTEHNLADDFEHASCVHTADVDGDDDLDILASAFSANEITWWENDGEQDFTEHTIKEDFAYAYSVHAADIDGDGDMDVLGAARDANEITWWESDLARSVLNGFVIDLENNQPLEGAVVTTTFGEETITDEDGYWLLIQVRGGLFDLTARMTGYNDSTMIDLELEQDDTLEVIFELLHPTIIPSVDGFSAELKREERTDIDFSIGNEGNGILEWSVGETSDDPWVLRESLNAGETVDDARLSGAVFTDDHFYITGGAVTQT